MCIFYEICLEVKILSIYMFIFYASKQKVLHTGNLSECLLK